MRIFILALVALVLTACGGSEDSSSSSSSSSSVPDAVSGLAISFSAIKSFDFTWTDTSDATYYKLMENKDGSSGFTQTGSDISSGSQTYSHIVPLYARMNAQYILQSCNDSGCTDSSTISISDSLVDSVGYIKASNTETGDLFGESLGLSSDGSTLAIGAYFEDSSATAINGDQSNNDIYHSGAVYIFTKSNKTWSQQAYLKASNTGNNDNFGYKLALSSDGSSLAVVSRLEGSSATGINGNESDNSRSNAGAVYVFTRNSNQTWSQQAYVKASNTQSGDYFGSSLALSSDGDTLAVGAYFEDSDATGINGDQANNNASYSGAAYVFTRDSTSNWTQQAYIKASNAEKNNYFGCSIALSSDGDTLVVGAYGDNSNATGVNGDQSNSSLSTSGAAYLFNRDSSNNWTQMAYIKPSNTKSSAIFGYALSLSQDGNTLAVGAAHENSNTTGINGDQLDTSASNAGAVYIFTQNSNTWSQEAYIKASNTDSGDKFGYHLSLSTDGSILAVGAPYEASNSKGINQTQTDNSTNSAGAIYVFTRSSTTWSQQAYLKASNTEASDKFGRGVSLSSDGNSLAIGAIDESSNATGIGGDQANNSTASSGAIYIY